MFSKVLVANRGEIAVRVIETAKSQGYRTVAVFSDADRNALHVACADQAVHIGASAVGESYLVAQNIIDAARKSGADAIHPGYGFLAENADFARLCEAEGLCFIGPGADAIELMGSKRLSKLAMQKAQVPCIPGYEGASQDKTALVDAARAIGFPVMIKASAGGGGRGMRLVHREEDMAQQIDTASSEASNAFGSGELILEKALIAARHIEIQIFADKHGNAVYLNERDCSIQRRHQKVLEEAPSPFVDSSLRDAMGTAAVQAALACNYVGAGTVEFLVDADKNFYFLEMNTRLQVEHPVTELITGTDLVAWQLQVAAGDPLPLRQEEVPCRGHAMEVRLYAEDVPNNFMPQTGEVLQWIPASGEGVRIDAGIQSGQSVSPHYDSMLAKLIAFGENREQARRRLIRAVEDSVLFGVTNNQFFLSNLLKHPGFISGAATTAFIETDFADDPSLSVSSDNNLAAALAAVLLYVNRQEGASYSDTLMSWQNSHPAPWPFELALGEELLQLSLQTKVTAENSFVVNVNAQSFEIALGDWLGSALSFSHAGVLHRAHGMLDGSSVRLKLGSQYYDFEDVTHSAAEAEGGAGSGTLVANMDGAIVDILVAQGDQVSQGQTLVVLEAMKMEHQLKADADGAVSVVAVNVGDQVKTRQLLVEIEIK